MARYFAGGCSPFAGATFDTLGENPDNCVTHDDLLALTCLGVHVGPPTLRWLLGNEGQTQCTKLLTRISPTAVLGKDEDEAEEPLVAAEKAWKMLQNLPSIDQVKAGKLLSRKRPHLVPIVDSVVKAVMKAPAKEYWQIFQAFMADEKHRNLVEDLRPSSAPADKVSLLRVLDAAVWMRGSRSKDAYKVRDEVIGPSGDNPDLPWVPRPS